MPFLPCKATAKSCPRLGDMLLARSMAKSTYFLSANSGYMFDEWIKVPTASGTYCNMV